MNNTSPQQSDNRPGVAIGHVDLVVTDVPHAVEYFVQLGMRPIHHDHEFAVLELRGGTHLVLETPEGNTTVEPGQTPPFDLMVDDLQQVHQHCVDRGWKPSPIETGRIHDNFYLHGPDGYRLRVTSSHTSGRAV
ncbi:MAG: VOC family protein [Nitrospirota bacterium]|nr:VOC family protein [Nitrospirota bacterium]